MNYNLDQSKMPLYENIQKYLEKSRIRLHMPGHKGLGDDFHISWEEDLTELPGLDNYHHPCSSIKESQKLLSELYKTEKSYFLVNGASVGIVAGLMSHALPGDKVLMPRHSHRSLYSAMVVSGVEPIYLPIEISPTLGLPLGIDPDYLENNSRCLAEAKLLIAQNPTYTGIAEDVFFIRNTLGSEMTLIADEAHGGHFFFHERFPPSALEADFDVVVHGAHKTLGSLTQTGFLHAGKKANLTRIEEALTVTQSTSPSYLLLASMDMARYRIAADGAEIFERILEKSDRIREEINKIPGLICLADRHLPDNRLLDPTRIVILTDDLELSGFELEEVLFQDYGIQVDMSGNNYVVAIIAVGDRNLDGEYLLRSFKDLAWKYESVNKKKAEPLQFFSQIPDTLVNPREAYFAEKERVDFDKSIGEISGETISPYPPGVPVICAGEAITHDIVEYIKYLYARGAYITGNTDPELGTINIIKQ